MNVHCTGPSPLRDLGVVGYAAENSGTADGEHIPRARELANTQESLRRLAMLIARGASPDTVYAAVTKEALRHFGSGTSRMIRYESDGTATLLANEGSSGPHVRVGETWDGFPADGLTATVRRTGQSARVDDYKQLAGGDPYVREGLRAAAGMPIHIDGRLWGMIAVGSRSSPLPHDVEQRMIDYIDLIVTAVANAQSSAELRASRARLVAASDEARRRIQRDLHDGAQQRLVSLVLRLRTAAQAADEDRDVVAEMADVVDELLALLDELREISHGIHPAILSRAGLWAALRALGRRSAVPMAINVDTVARLPQAVEVAVYYVVSEMLTNAAKHARASVVEVDAEIVGPSLLVRVRDDGVGGADPTRGSGLTGLKDRVEALGGTFLLDSPTGNGTTIHCEFPPASLADGR
jgi:signal transduction histidine kinase